ncbi:MAG: RNA methyltransferase [Bacteroidales bacterium]|nr:RNA methyltransferase [Bacteroidales bacterium]
MQSKSEAMLSKNQIKYFRSFHAKKTRDAEKKFIVEGTKVVEELLATSLAIHSIVATEDWIAQHTIRENINVFSASEEELHAISVLQHPQQVWALVEQAQAHTLFSSQGLVLALDNLQDPGNMGTILRIADWFGVEQVLCSPHCVELYNPKVVQASMGAIFRVPVLQGNLLDFFAQCEHSNIFAADLEGENVYSAVLPANSILVMGNEGNGISEEIRRSVPHKLHIPSFKFGSEQSESLNVAMATAILCSEFKRITIA